MSTTSAKNTLFFNIIKYLFIIFTILFNSVYFYQVQFHYVKYFINIGWQLLLILLCIITLTNRKYHFNDARMFSSLIIFFIIVIIILVSYYIYKPYSLVFYVFEFAIDPILIILYFYCSSTNKKFNLNLLYIFERIMVILSIISLFFYVIYYLGIRPSQGLLINWGTNIFRGASYYPNYLYIGFVPSTNYLFMGQNVLRNTSIFVEAPIYSYFLYVALLIDLFLHRNKFVMNRRVIILLITIFSTFSTTGMILSVISILLAVIFRYKNLLLKVLFIIFTPVFIYMIEILFSEKKNMPTASIFDYVNSSYYVRHNDFIAFLEAWHKHLIFGNGIGNTSSIYKYVNYLRLGVNGDSGLTADFFELLAFGGLILILFYIIPTLLTIFVSPNVFYFAMFNFIVFMVEGIMLYRIYIFILSFCIAIYFWKKYKKDVNYI